MGKGLRVGCNVLHLLSSSRNREDYEVCLEIARKIKDPVMERTVLGERPREARERGPEGFLHSIRGERDSALCS